MVTRTTRDVIAVLCALAVPRAVADGGAHARRPLQLRGGDVWLADTPTCTPQPAASAAERHIIQFDGPLSAEQREALDDAGVVLEDYLPEYAYVADLRAADRDQLAELPFVARQSPLQREWKIDAGLIAAAAETVKPSGVFRLPTPARRYHDAERQALSAAAKVKVVITTFRGEDANDVLRALVQIPGVEQIAAATGGSRVYVDAVLSVAALTAVADLPFVQFVEDAPEAELRNNTTSRVVQSGNIPTIDPPYTAAPVWDNGLHGENLIIGLIDGTPSFAHCMFSDVVPIGPTHRKVVAARNTSAVNSHGTHTAGTLAGDQPTYNVYDANDGIAYAARLSFSDYFAVNGNPSTLEARFVDAHADGARVHSNSWGDDYTTAYTTWCQQIDDFSYNYEDDLVCFSVSNGAYLKTPENAKNVLAVGASSQYPNHNNACYGGQGPTADGRRKPEIYAPGCSIWSAGSSTSCGTTSKSGTSMACPAVAASATLARQYYLEGFYPSGAANAVDTLTPSGALLKATLLNATLDMTGLGLDGYPSNKEGWGRFYLDRSLYFAGDQRRLIVHDVRNAAGLLTSESNSYETTVWSGVEDLRVTLVFTDPPAAVNASNPVINDLDLIVTGPAGGVPGAAVYYGNYFSSGQSVSGGSADPLNNVEQVYLITPEPGQYTIEVAATAVNQGTQGYALVISGRVSEGNRKPWRGFGDYDHDGDNDLVDFGFFQACFAGSGVSYGDQSCAVFDIEPDFDIDADDLTAFEGALAGPAS